MFTRPRGKADARLLRDRNLPREVRNLLFEVFHSEHYYGGMKPEEIAYVAALYEGEGCVIWNKPGTKSGGKNGRATISIVMTDLEPLQKFKAFLLGKGRLIGPYKHSHTNKKPIWRYTLTGWKEVAWFFETTKDWLSPRRYNRLVEVLKNKPPERVLPPRAPYCGVDPTIPSKAGYDRHRYKGERPCLECSQANNLKELLRRRAKYGEPKNKKWDNLS